MEPIHQCCAEQQAEVGDKGTEIKGVDIAKELTRAGGETSGQWCGEGAGDDEGDGRMGEKQQTASVEGGKLEEG